MLVICVKNNLHLETIYESILGKNIMIVEFWSQLIHVMMSQVAHAPLERDLETPDTYGKFFFKSLSLDIRVNNKPMNNDALVVVALKCY